MTLNLRSTSATRCWVLALAALPGAGIAQTTTAPRSEVVIESAGPMPGAPPIFELPIDLGAMGLSADSLSGGRLVKGAPYCADAVHETVQVLPDANGVASNRIVRQNQSRLCRDGEGRSRQEVERSGRKLVYLHDPVARETWLLDVDKKIARRVPADAAAWSTHRDIGSAANWRDYADQVRAWSRNVADRAMAVAVPPPPPVPPASGPHAVAVPPRPGDPQPVTIVRREREIKGDGSAPREIEMHVVRRPGAGAPMPPDLPAPPGVAWTASSWAPRGQAAVTSLGSKDIEGLRVNGERSTWTIEAGKVGNEKPIVIARDVWTSPDLMVTVQSRDVDPRRGESSYRLANLRRGEPDAAAMKVPADYSRR